MGNGKLWEKKSFKEQRVLTGEELQGRQISPRGERREVKQLIIAKRRQAAREKLKV